MRCSTEISRDGPYCRVLLPDVLATDWEALRRDLESEIEEGASRVTLIASRPAGSLRDDPQLIEIVGSLRSSGLDAVVFHADGN